MLFIYSSYIFSPFVFMFPGTALSSTECSVWSGHRGQRVPGAAQKYGTTHTGTAVTPINTYALIHTPVQCYINFYDLILSFCVLGEWSWIWGMFGRPMWCSDWSSQPQESPASQQSNQRTWTQTLGKHNHTKHPQHPSKINTVQCDKNCTL